MITSDLVRRRVMDAHPRYQRRFGSVRDVPDPKVTAWLDRQPGTSIWTTSTTIFDFDLGMHTMPGRKKTSLSEDFEKPVEQMVNPWVA